MRFGEIMKHYSRFHAVPSTSTKSIAHGHDSVISFQLGEAGCEGFAWYAVTEGRDE